MPEEKLYIGVASLTKADIIAAKTRHQKATSRYLMHKIAWEFFKDKEERNFIFVFSDHEATSCSLIVRSFEKPSIPEVIDSDKVRVLEDELYSSLKKGAKYAFSMHVNPTRHVGKSKHAITNYDDIRKWLISKGDNYGFKMNEEEVLVSNTKNQISYKPSSNSNLTYLDAEVYGMLEITDLKRFKDTYCKGFGGQRGMGFGMMLLSPINTKLNKSQKDK